MPSADAIVTRSGPVAVPLAYTVPATEEIVPLTMRAHFDGTSAAGAFLPALQIVSQNGSIVATATTADPVAAGASADVTWFPGFLEAAASSVAGVFWPAANQSTASYDSTSWLNGLDSDGTFYDAVAVDGAATGAVGALGFKGQTAPTMVASVQPAWYFSDGSFDPGNGPYGGITVETDVHGNSFACLAGAGAQTVVPQLDAANPTIKSVTLFNALFIAKATAGSGAGFRAGASIYTGNNAPAIGGLVGDIYIRCDSAAGVGTTLYRCTVAGAPTFATWSAIL